MCVYIHPWPASVYLWVQSSSLLMLILRHVYFCYNQHSFHILSFVKTEVIVIVIEWILYMHLTIHPSINLKSNPSTPNSLSHPAPVSRRTQTHTHTNLSTPDLGPHSPPSKQLQPGEAPAAMATTSGVPLGLVRCGTGQVRGGRWCWGGSRWGGDLEPFLWPCPLVVSHHWNGGVPRDAFMTGIITDAWCGSMPCNLSKKKKITGEGRK